jgi:photosystem II stability/assembly factor-like uncharacterized protein
MPTGTTSPFYGIDMSTDELLGIAAGGSGILKWSSDGGRTWNNSTAAGSVTLRAVSFVPNSRTAWVVGATGKVLKTTDGGATFIDQTANASAASGGVALYGVFAVNENRVHVVGSGGKAIRSDNGGATWYNQNSQTSNTLYSVHFANTSNGWAVGAGGTITSTVNGGEDWAIQQSGTTETLRSVAFLGSTYGFAVGDNRTMKMFSESQWQTYPMTAVPSGTSLQSVDIFDTLHYVVGGSSGWVAESTDGSLNWSAQQTNSGNQVFSIRYGATANAKYAAGYNGTIMKNDSGNPTTPTGLGFSTGGTVTSNSNPTFTWNASTDAETSVVNYQYVLYNQGLVVDTGNINSTTPSYSLNVVNRDKFVVRAIDLAGNQSAPAEFNFIYDATPPTVGAPSPATATAGQSVTISASYSDTQTAVVICGLYVDNIPQQGNMNLAGGTASMSYAFTSAGSHTVKVECRDEASNIGSATTAVSVAAATVPTPDTTPSASTSLISASPSSVTADNSSTATVTVTVKNAASSALSGKSVSLISSRPSYDTVTSISPTTNSSGQATFSVRSTSAGTSSLTATVDGISVGPTTVTFTVQTTTPPPTPSDTVVSSAKSLVIAAPKKVKATGSHSGTVVVVAKNASGQVLSGKTVYIYSSLSGVTIQPSQTVTSAFGVATFQVKSTNIGTANFSAVADGVTLQAKPSIYFTAYTAIACLNPAVPVGTLVKLPDDSNPATQEDTAVYYYGYDCKRHAFPNSKTYFTWYQNFNDVSVVTPELLATMQLGLNVRYRPGIRMVKFTTVNKVYAVSMNGELRWVTSEAVASSLYGPSWNKSIDDISDAFYTNYNFGSDINDANEFQLSAEVDNSTSISDDL